MKRAGQRCGFVRARRTVRLRAVYRTAGAHEFHRAIRDGLKPASRHAYTLQPNAPRRVKHNYTPSSFSPSTERRRRLKVTQCVTPFFTLYGSHAAT